MAVEDGNSHQPVLEITLDEQIQLASKILGLQAELLKPGKSCNEEMLGEVESFITSRTLPQSAIIVTNEQLNNI